MAELHVIGSLREKRSELCGVMKQLEQRLEQNRAALAHLDATIRLRPLPSGALIRRAKSSAMAWLVSAPWPTPGVRIRSSRPAPALPRHAPPPSNGSTRRWETSKPPSSEPTERSMRSMCRATSPSSNAALTDDTISPPGCRSSPGLVFERHPCPTGCSSWPTLCMSSSLLAYKNWLRKLRKQEGECLVVMPNQAVETAAPVGGGTGWIGALLRHHGLYSLALSEWRRQRDVGTLGALTPARRSLHRPRASLRGCPCAA